jgi:hypothetical protein
VYKSKTLALKTLYSLQNVGYFRILVFGVNSNISGTLTYNVFLSLFSGKKIESGMKKQDPVF